MQGSNIHWINGNVSQIITDKSGESNRIKAVKYVSGATSKMIDADFVVGEFLPYPNLMKFHLVYLDDDYV